MNVDLEIYINNIKKFFKNNPKDLLSLVPQEKEEDLYIKIRDRALKNVEEGLNPVLTQKQIIDICVEINKGKSEKDFFDHRVFNDAPFGKICLN